MEINTRSKVTTVGPSTIQIVTLHQALETFLHQALADLSPKTYQWYEFRLSEFVATLGSDRTLVEIMEADLRAWYADLAGSGTRYASGQSSRPPIEGKLSVYTRHGYLRAVKRLFNWLKEAGILHDNPATRLKLPKLPKGGKEGISDTDARKMIEVAKQNGLRDTALLLFFHATGCRLGGAESLRLADLRLDAPEPLCRRVTLREKGSKERTAFLTLEAQTALHAWLTFRPDVDDTHVFLGQKNGQDWQPITEWGLREIFKRCAATAGVTKNWGPHEWRHGFARRLLEQGMSLASVSQILGHENVEVTVRYYGQFAVAQLQEQFDRFNGQ